MFRMKLVMQAVDTTHIILTPANKETGQNVKTDQCV
jgi:hypothetical protein